MKKYISIFVMVSAFIGSNIINAQVDKQSAIKVANQLFNACKNNDYRSTADILAYHGSDEARLYKDTYNYTNSQEASEVKRFCRRMKAMVEISDSYEFGSFKTRKVHGHEVKSLDVIFKSGNQKIKNKLIFIAINGKPVIYRLD